VKGMISRTGLGLLFLGGRLQTFITCVASLLFSIFTSKHSFCLYYNEFHLAEWLFIYSMFGWCAYSRIRYGQPNLKQNSFSTILYISLFCSKCMYGDEKRLQFRGV
jgi:hypothetical protein